MRVLPLSAIALALILAGCSEVPAPADVASSDTHTDSATEIYGTTEPFAEEAIYFVVTDRFVNGDPANDQRQQGGQWRTFDRPVSGAPSGESDNIGYLGGDFKGVVDNADYLRDLGFTAIWVTPIIDNPDAAFAGGKPASWGSFWTDQGKTGYHGYWGVNFYKLDEHLPSPGLDFAGFTAAMHGKQMKVVLDIVGNHGSPSYTMPTAQPEFGKVYDQGGNLIADHQNLAPASLDPANNPLHRFFNTQAGIAELSDFNETNPAVLEYLAGAYGQWLDQGADAFRIDTIGWMPHSFWKAFADRVRAKRPNLFMFGENFKWHPEEIAPHTWPENGGISVLDFPLKKAMADVFEKLDTDYARIGQALHLVDGPYQNPYELVTFYDNHDMPRLNATDEGFVDANNFLFTARGVPAVYYGSEVGFMRGRAEHAGNRNYFGQERINAAPAHPIYQGLRRIAKIRAGSSALQKGLQLNLEFAGEKAAFYRVYQHDGANQIALVLLNKGNEPASFAVTDFVEAGDWSSAVNGRTVAFTDRIKVTVPAHGVEVLLHDGAVTRADFKQALMTQMSKTGRAVVSQ